MREVQLRFNLITARSSADKNREISCRVSGGGPRVVAPALRKPVSRSRVASAMPIESRERLAGRADHGRAFFHAAAGQRNVGGDDDIACAGAFDDPVVGHIGPSLTITRSIMSLRGTS